MRWDRDAALRETKQSITVFAIRGLVTQEAIDRYGDRLDIVLVDLGSRPTWRHPERLWPPSLLCPITRVTLSN
ncbi:hypothetical protein GCM10023323_15510 [Streptomyces thinghirensis]|uniref:Uncharacterized protein n=1 Tax=Streptomyces thinghirensis TaxID=551547 RepID=A0ABP9T1M7_9ACTN